MTSFVPFLVLVARVFGAADGSPRTDGAAAVPTDAFRLPADTVPVSYDLRVTPDYGDRRGGAAHFDGEVDITVAVTRNTSVVTLNARGLFVYVAYVHEKVSERLVDVVGIGYDDAAERVAIRLESELRAGVRYAVNVEYRGTVGTGRIDGVYNSTCGRGEWLLVSYIEPTGAREIFPCYDEPAYKTPFNISLMRPNDKFSISNMPNSTSYIDHSTQLIREVFNETPPMATHQVAFMVSSFYGSVRDGVSNSSAIHAFTHSDYSDQIQYVSDTAPRLLEIMEEFTTVRYELPKLALFAVPDFKSDAMGNWGLTTYREKYLLLNDMSSAKAYEIGLSMVQREMARQWFGNLVTCSWWDYLWLHDAFTVYFQYFAMNSVYPEWRMDLMFVVEKHQMALAYDQKPKRPITASVRTPAEINEVFYDKGSEKAAAFLRMLKCVTNDTIFQQSLALYLKQNTYKSVGPESLFAAFESTISEHDYSFGQNFTITSFMRQWTEQPGYPMINVTKVNDTFIITQERFLIDMPNKTIDLSKWFVGLTYTTESVKDFENVKPIAWCNPPAEECVVSAPRDSGWFIFNVQSTGFYRVNYDPENWYLLINQLKKNSSEINVLNRAQLVDDSFNLARAGKLHYSVTLQLSSYLEMEDDVIPWYSAIDGYTYLLERMRRNDTEYSKLKECVSRLSEIIYLKLEELIELHNTSDHSILTSWNALSAWTCGLDNEKCKQSALEYYKKWQKGEKIPTDIRDAAFCVGVHVFNTTATWEEMLQLYKSTKSPSEKQSAQKALACTDNDNLLSKYLNYIFAESNGPIRTQDFKDVFTAVSSTPKGLNVMIDFLAQNLNRITTQLVDGDQLAIFIYSICSSKAALDSEIIRIKNLKDDQAISTNLRIAFNEKYQQVEHNLHWYTKYHEIVNVNVFCSSVHTTTEDLQESTTYQQTTFTTQLSSTTLPTKTTEQIMSTESTTLNITYTESQTTQQTSSGTSPYSITSTIQPEISSEKTRETSASIGTSTEKIVTTTESLTSNQTSTEQQTTTTSTFTESSTLFQTSTDQPKTSSYSPTVSPVTTSYTSTESSTLYSSTEQDNTTLYKYSSTTESLPTNGTSTEQSVTTICTSEEPSSSYDPSTEQTETTLYSSIEPTTAYYNSTFRENSTTTKMPTVPSQSTVHSTTSHSSKQSTLTETTSTVLYSTKQSEITTNSSESTLYSAYTEHLEVTTPSTISHGTSEKYSTKTQTTESTENYSMTTSPILYDSTTVLTDHSEDSELSYEITIFWYYLLYTLFLIVTICVTYIICVYNYKYYPTNKCRRQ